MVTASSSAAHPLSYREALFMANLARFALTIGATALIAGCGLG